MGRRRKGRLAGCLRRASRPSRTVSSRLSARRPPTWRVCAPLAPSPPPCSRWRRRTHRSRRRRRRGAKASRRMGRLSKAGAARWEKRAKGARAQQPHSSAPLRPARPWRRGRARLRWRRRSICANREKGCSGGWQRWRPHTPPRRRSWVRRGRRRPRCTPRYSRRRRGTKQTRAGVRSALHSTPTSRARAHVPRRSSNCCARVPRSWPPPHRRRHRRMRACASIFATGRVRTPCPTEGAASRCTTRGGVVAVSARSGRRHGCAHSWRGWRSVHASS
mmetsp:Transcript_5401/g.14116  ORF Transcript_5401/g.14116 Transcript_5401/m.14116 type:complete len:276 (-) Transcript_5401:394-1221(-)